MIDVIHSFDEKGTRDELGIAPSVTVWPSCCCPGTGTVQTRARYFLFIPWIYRELEQRDTPSHEIAEKARAREIELIYALEKGGEKKAGVIGVEARDERAAASQHHLLEWPRRMGSAAFPRLPGSIPPKS